MVDVIGPIRVQVAQWVVGQCRQVDDAVEAAQVLDRDVPDILMDGGHRPVAVAEDTVAEEPGIETDDGVAGGREIGSHDRADVALVTGDKDAHQIASTSLRIGWVESPDSMSW